VASQAAISTKTLVNEGRSSGLCYLGRYLPALTKIYCRNQPPPEVGEEPGQHPWEVRGRAQRSKVAHQAEDRESPGRGQKLS